MISVVFNDRQIALARYHGFMRQLNNVRSGVVDRNKKCNRNGNRDGVQVNTDGVAGEIAYGIAFDAHVDLTIGVRRGCADAIARDGTRIDVKTIGRTTNDLLLVACSGDYSKIDAFVLADVRYFAPRIDLFGMIHKTHVMRCRRDAFLFGECWVVSRTNPHWELF